jgi:signal transduction histidine kinase
VRKGDHRDQSTGSSALSAAVRPAPLAGSTGSIARRVGPIRPWLPFATVAGAALVATLAVPVVAPLQTAYAAPSLDVALDTGVAVIGLMATAIVVPGWRDGLRLDRLVIAAGLALIATTFAVLTALMTVTSGYGPRGLIGIAGTLVGSVLLAVGAFAPARPVRAPRTAVLSMLGITVAALAVVGGPFALVLAEKPIPPLDFDLAGAGVSQPLGVLAIQLAGAAGLALAAVGLTARGVRTGDAFARRLGLAVLFFAFAKLHDALLPPISEWVHIGDLLRLLFCVVLLWTAVVEVTGTVARRAAESERRRIARDLHDGVAQELAFIRRRAVRLAAQPDAQDIVVAADRALLDSRAAIERLLRAADEPLDRVLARQAVVIAARTGVRVTFSSSGSASAGPEVSEALARILGEAVTNARHGNATRVHIELSCDPLRLRVVDDGTGFDVAAKAPGFGLGGMQERAALVGAELSVRSEPGAGTEVAVKLR